MRDDPTTEQPRLAPVLTDEPVVIPQPRKAVARVAIAYGLAILVVGACAAYIGGTVGYNRASQRTDRRIAVLERYLDERRNLRDAEKRQADADKAAAEARAQRLRELVCVFADRLPRDAEIERVRAEFGCTGEPPQPSTQPTSMPDGPTPGQPRSGATPQQIPPPRGGQPNPVPQPPVEPPDPPDEPEPDDGGGLLCLPLLGCLL